MTITIFYSWQSDFKESKHRKVIETSIRNAANKFFDDEIIIDRDTIGHSGSPDILEVLINKIEKCDIFIADVAIINKDYQGKKVPNPNVMFETGYATAYLKKDNVILIFNDESGKIDDLPFDIDHRRILRFESSNSIELEKKLTANFKNIKQNFDKRDKTRKAKLKNVTEIEKDALKAFLRLYNRAAFYAPFQQEESIKMYDSINQAKIDYQKMKFKISDNATQQKLEQFIELIQKAIVEVRETCPSIHEYSQKINVPSDKELLRDGILNSYQTNYVINTLYNLRDSLNPLSVEIEKYYNDLP